MDIAKKKKRNDIVKMMEVRKTLPLCLGTQYIHELGSAFLIALVSASPTLCACLPLPVCSVSASLSGAPWCILDCVFA